VVERRAIMGMPVAVAGVAPELAERVFAWLREVDARFSTYRRGSEISRLNRGELGLRDTHPDVREVLARCEALRAETDGYFDANLMRTDRSSFVDPTGLVKGWAVDRAGALLDAAGVERWCIDAGGDVLLRGGPWRVGIRHPRRRRKLAAVLALSDAAVATSGTYERGRHIVDPHTGRPPAGVASVTVVGRELATADAYATAAFAMGAAGPRWTARLEGCSALTILGDRMLSTPGLAAHRSEV
jgi:thiamine biosynthesis lipoprotein